VRLLKLSVPLDGVGSPKLNTAKETAEGDEQNAEANAGINKAAFGGGISLHNNAFSLARTA